MRRARRKFETPSKAMRALGPYGIMPDDRSVDLVVDDSTSFRGAIDTVAA